MNPEDSVAGPVLAGQPGDALVPVPTPARGIVKVSSPESLLALVPQLLGFHPRDSLVLLGARPPAGRVALTLRWDLAAAQLPGGARNMVAQLKAAGCTALVAVGYGPDASVAPCAKHVQDAARVAGLKCTEALRADHGRYWSYLCEDPSCCAPEGVPYDTAGHRVTRAFEAAGAPPVQASREAVAASLVPPHGDDAGQMWQALAHAARKASRLAAREHDPGRRSPVRPIVASGFQALSTALRTCHDGGTITWQQAAWLARVLAEQEVFTAAWLRMHPAQHDSHQQLWADVLRRVPPEHASGTALLLAFTAWQSGNGALANMALDRVPPASPGHHLAQALRTAVTSGADPSLADPAAMMQKARPASQHQKVITRTAG